MLLTTVDFHCILSLDIFFFFSFRKLFKYIIIYYHYAAALQLYPANCYFIVETVNLYWKLSLYKTVTCHVKLSLYTINCSFTLETVNLNCKLNVYTETSYFALHTATLDLFKSLYNAKCHSTLLYWNCQFTHQTVILPWKLSL